LIASGLGVVFLGERITPTMLLGMAVIFAGLAVFDRAGKKNKLEAVSQPA